MSRSAPPASSAKVASNLSLNYTSMQTSRRPWSTPPTSCSKQPRKPRQSSHTLLELLQRAARLHRRMVIGDHLPDIPQQLHHSNRQHNLEPKIDRRVYRCQI